LSVVIFLIFLDKNYAGISNLDSDDNGNNDVPATF